MNKPIVFYIDPTWRREMPHIPLLYPFWGNCLDKDRVPYQYALFERHHFDTTLYLITEKAEEADMVLMPYAYNLLRQHAPEMIASCVAEANKQGKFLLVDGVGDVEYPVAMSNVLILRYGGYTFSLQGNEIIIPPYADDLLEVYCGGELRIRQKRKKAKIGFSGWAELTPKQELRAFVKELHTRMRSIFDSHYKACKKGIFFRRDAISALQHSPIVETNFLIRRSYSGHSDTASDTAERLQQEFVDNLLSSDYGLDVRGDANASTRLFEMLSLGCIPVIVDTERNFPFRDGLDYSSFAIIVNFRDIQKLPEKIAEFHRNISQERFEQMQRNARDAYCTYFRVDVLTRPLMEEIRKRACL